jgi:hypothetical protein
MTIKEKMPINSTTPATRKVTEKELVAPARPRRSRPHLLSGDERRD